MSTDRAVPDMLEDRNIARFKVRRVAARHHEKDQRAKRLLKEVSAHGSEARPTSNSRRDDERIGRSVPSGPARPDPMTVLALIGLGWLLGLLVFIGALFALIRWVWDAVMKLSGV